jgi:hypothetical protein
MRQVTTGQTGGSVQAIAQRIEDVRTFANQTVTFSFWAKADTSRNWTCRFIQSFGASGSGDVSTANSTNFAVTTSWQRFSATFTLPSIAGKTIGAGSYLYAIIDGPVNTGQTMDVWGVQVEAGSVATAFQTATGTIQGELAACQRYYYRTTGNTSAGGHPAFCATQSAASAYCYMPLPVTMRTNPSAIDYSGVRLVNYGVAAYAITSLNLSASETSPSCAVFTADGASGMTANRPVFLYASASTNYIGFSAEL